jgi:predicted nucleotidyltransferase
LDIGSVLSEVQKKEVVERLQILHPQRIFLFGSNASGDAIPGRSDVDPLVVVPDDEESSYAKAVRAYGSLRGMGFPKDIVVRHKRRFDERRLWKSSIEYNAAETGQVLSHVIHGSSASTSCGTWWNCLERRVLSHTPMFSTL